MKDYLKPDAELVSLVAEEAITGGLEEELGNGELGLESSLW